jgi:hypothetical protein
MSMVTVLAAHHDDRQRGSLVASAVAGGDQRRRTGGVVTWQRGPILLPSSIDHFYALARLREFLFWRDTETTHPFSRGVFRLFRVDVRAKQLRLFRGCFACFGLSWRRQPNVVSI